MTEHQEPSYYEIALTNRQVLVAFVILLACVLASFFAGVWVGKGSPAAAASAEVPAEAPEPTPGEGTPEELSFFTDGERPDLGKLAENPRPETTLAEDLGVERPAASPPPAPTATPVASPAQRAAGEERPARPRPSPTATATPAAAAPAELAPGQVVIQVFSSRDEAQARLQVDRLKAAGLSAFLSPSGAMYRVRIGPYSDRRRAETDAERVRRDFRLDTWITGAP